MQEGDINLEGLEPQESPSDSESWGWGLLGASWGSGCPERTGALGKSAALRAGARSR